MTHDVEFKLPEMMFDGAKFKISPRSIEGNGALVKIEFLPRVDKRSLQLDTNTASPRLLFKKISKFSCYVYFNEQVVLFILFYMGSSF